MSEQTKLESCPLCHSPHTNLARDLAGDVQQAFCKVCGCSAPIAAWNYRAVQSMDDSVETMSRQCREALENTRAERAIKGKRRPR